MSLATKVRKRPIRNLHKITLANRRINTVLKRIRGKGKIQDVYGRVPQ